MTDVRRRVVHRVGRPGGPLDQLARQAFLARCGWAARAARDAEITVEVAPWARPHAQVRVVAWPGTRTRIVIGSNVRLGERTLISARGGTLVIGDDTDVRRFCTFNVAGDITIGSGVVISNGTSVHCAERVAIGDLTIVGEWSTLADSAHLRTPPGVPVHHASRTAPVSVGTNCWLGARVTVGSGVRVGDQVVVGSGSVVTRDVEDGWLVAGVPARPVRELAIDESYET